MTDETLIAIMKSDESVRRWFLEAADHGWSDLSRIAESAMHGHGELRGFLWCEHCDCPIVDPAIDCGLSGESIAVMLNGDVTLCGECYDAAIAAQKKIVVHQCDDDEYDEDRSALDEDEAELVSYLDRSRAARR